MKNYIQPDWPAPPQIRAYTTLRHGWGGSKLIGTKEDQDLKTLLNLPDEPIWMTQNHGIKVIEAKPENKKKEADASYTTKLNRICIVLTADCLPILLCNKQGSYVAAIHAGWRGLANGIIESTLNALQQFPEDLLVWFGPAIGPQKFEVGKDVYDAFILKNPAASQAFLPCKKNKWLANLYELARLILAQRGIFQIFGGNFCTFTQDDLFFSYRRDKGQTGRIASLIWISH